MKRAWEEAILEAAASGKRFDHDEDCRVIFLGGGKTKNCKCGASAANKALNEMEDALRVGVVLSET